MRMLKSIVSILLVLMLTLSMVACTTIDKTVDKDQPNAIENSIPQGVTTEKVDDKEPTDTVEKIETQLKFFSMSLTEGMDNIKALTAFINEDGTTYIEYIGEVRKLGVLDENVMDEINQAVLEAQLDTLNKTDEYNDGDRAGDMYLEYTNGDVVTFSFSGTEHDLYEEGYASLDELFNQLTKEMAEYVARPQVMGAVNSEILDEMMMIFDASGLTNLDGIMIDEIYLDESFAGVSGLDDMSCVSAAANGAPMMMSVAYSLVVVKVNENADIDKICKNFENNLDWQKWVCVAPSNALIATKGNMVLCLMGSDNMYSGTVQGINSNGWEIASEIMNPAM